MNIAQARELVGLLRQWREAAAPICNDPHGTRGTYLAPSELKGLRLVAASHDGLMARLDEALERIGAGAPKPAPSMHKALQRRGVISKRRKAK